MKRKMPRRFSLTGEASCTLHSDYLGDCQIGKGCIVFQVQINRFGAVYNDLNFRPQTAVGIVLNDNCRHAVAQQHACAEWECGDLTGEKINQFWVKQRS